MTTAFLYKWTELSTGKWYVGSRTAKNCHPGDGYICSSKYVKPMILENRDNWSREILVIGNPTYIRNLENTYLCELNAKADIMSYNKSNADGNFTALDTKNSGAPKGVIPWNKGLSTKNGTMKKRQLSSKSRSDKGKPKLHQRGPAKVAYRGYYIDSCGVKFVSALQAADKYKLDPRTISKWAKQSQNGWDYEPVTRVPEYKRSRKGI